MPFRRGTHEQWLMEKECERKIKQDLERIQETSEGVSESLWSLEMGNRKLVDSKEGSKGLLQKGTEETRYLSDGEYSTQVSEGPDDNRVRYRFNYHTGGWNRRT